VEHLLSFEQTTTLPLAAAQAVWDRRFNEALKTFNEPNPELCRDLALDKTIRELGQRPRAPLTRKERQDLKLRMEVEELFAENYARSEYFADQDRRKRGCTAEQHTFETLCEDDCPATLEECEVAQ